MSEAALASTMHRPARKSTAVDSAAETTEDAEAICPDHAGGFASSARGRPRRPAPSSQGPGCARRPAPGAEGPRLPGHVQRICFPLVHHDERGPRGALYGHLPRCYGHDGRPSRARRAEARRRSIMATSTMSTVPISPDPSARRGRRVNRGRVDPPRAASAITPRPRPGTRRWGRGGSAGRAPEEDPRIRRLEGHVSDEAPPRFPRTTRHRR